MQGEDAGFDDGQRPQDAQRGRLPVRRGGSAFALRLVPARRSWTTRIAVLLFDAVVLCALVLAGAALLLSDREVSAPGWVTAQVAQRLDADLPQARLSLGRVSLQFDRLSPPRLRLHDVRLARLPDAATLPAGGTADMLRIPVAEIGLRRRALLAGRIQPDAVRLSGARVLLARDAQGRFDLGVGTEGGFGAPTALPDLLAQLDAIFAQPLLAGITRIEATDITLDLRDARAGRSWTVEQGRITLAQSAQEIRIGTTLRFPGDAPQGPGGAMVVPEVEIVLTTRRPGGGATLAARLEGVPAPDIAAQSAALAWLAAVRAPVFGALRADMTPEGGLGPISAKLELGAGALATQVKGDSLPFDMARAYFTVSPSEGRVDFDDLRLRSPVLGLAGTAQVFAEGGSFLSVPDALIAQVQARDLTLNLPDTLPAALSFTNAASDLRITLDPFTVEVGQLSLLRTGPEPLRLIAQGRAARVPEGWQVALDASVPRARARDVIDLWPAALAPRSRDWVAGHVRRGVVSDVEAALRIRPGQAPLRQVTWRFADLEIAPLPGFPAITGGAGVAALTGPDFSVVLEAGAIMAPGHGRVDLSGTGFRIPDGRLLPPEAQLDLAASGALPDLLAVLDQPPLSLLRGVPADLVLADRGRAALSGRMNWPLRRGVRLAEMDMALTAELRDVEATRLVPGHVLRAPALTLRADTAMLTIGGAADLSGIPLEAVFSRPLGEAGRGQPSRVEGTAQLSAPVLEALGIALPPGSVTGAGRADVVVTLPAGGAAPSFVLTSDLNRIALSVPPLGWAKPADALGLLRVEGTLGAVPDIPLLDLEAPGLRATGAVRFAEAGGGAALDLSRVRIGGWLDAPVRLRPSTAGGAPNVTLGSGRIDLSRVPGRVAGANTAGTRAAPIVLNGMRLRVSDQIVLSDVAGEVTPGSGGLSGAFSGRVNGAAPIRGQVAPAQNGGGTAVRITGADAGAVLRAAGVFDRATGGELALVLQPIPGAAGYDGTLAVTDTRVTSAPGLSTLLNAISIVGLLDELAGSGLVFSSIDADFRLSDGRLVLRQGAGVGPSIGISMQGSYDLAADRLDMQGVLSPIYLLNGIGQIFTRRGEGLFGFNYAMSGPAEAPQVTVNPLSVLTPGMFRDLFRAPPPQR